MFGFLFKKKHRIEKLLYAYLDNFQLTQQSFTDALHSCILSPTQCKDFDFKIRQTHKFESKADDICEEINNLMYSKALIPESREDIMRLLEAFDKIPALFERILFATRSQGITIPEFLRLDLTELFRISLECCDLVVRQAEALLNNSEGIRSLMTTIDTNESHCDHFERRIVTKIFESDLEPYSQIQLKDLVIHIGDISDEADRVAKRINIISLKRRV